MRTQSSTITIADYCRGLERREYTVNKNYQRSDSVWPVAAKSFLIETILLDYPVPKLSLHQRLDLLTRTTVKDIVDGQQRSRAIMDFYENRLRLSRSILSDRFAGRTLNDLDPEDQAQFLNYGLNFDIFVAAAPEEVREVFRRMNSFTVPLNPEEARHANFQGPFKWFIHSLSRDYDRSFQAAGVFSEKQINRMLDAKLLTEITHAMVHGFTTTNRASLDRMYSDFDQSFEEADEFDSVLRGALDKVLGNDVVRDTPLVKPYNVYSLTLAFIFLEGRLPSVDTAFDLDTSAFRHGEPEFNLGLLAEAAEMSVDDVEGDGAETAARSPLAGFVEATRDRTNVASQRRTRFQYFVAALTV